MPDTPVRKDEGQLEWFKCGTCGWQRAILQDVRPDAPGWPIGECPRCNEDAMEPTVVEHEWPAEMAIGDYLDLDEEQQDDDWRSMATKKMKRRTK